MVTNTKQRGCGQKIPHDSRKAAEGHMWQMVIQRGAALCRLNVYRCKHGPHWHVGHKPRRR